MFAKIKGLGFEPSVMVASSVGSENEESVWGAEEQIALPEPVAMELASAADDGELLLIDFHAKWCGPCIKMDREVFAREDVQKALEAVHFLKVDTDEFPQAAKFFGVVALPTILVLDGERSEVLRKVGPMGWKEFIGAVEELTR